MGTLDLLFPATRRELLVLFFGQANREFYFRELIRLTDKGLGAVQRELANLVLSGVVVREDRQGRSYYRANVESPIFGELRSLIIKTEGLVDVIKEALRKIEKIRVAFIYGSIARGEETAQSDVDIAIIGDCTLQEVVAALSVSQDKIGRELNPTVYPAGEFRRKAKKRHHFVRSLIDGDKIVVIGSPHELKGVASQRLADETSVE